MDTNASQAIFVGTGSALKPHPETSNRQLPGDGHLACMTLTDEDILLLEEYLTGSNCDPIHDVAVHPDYNPSESVETMQTEITTVAAACRDGRVRLYRSRV